MKAIYRDWCRVHHNFRYWNFSVLPSNFGFGTTANGPLFPLSPVLWPDTTSKKVFHQSWEICSLHLRIPRPASFRSITLIPIFDKEVLFILLHNDWIDCRLLVCPLLLRIIYPSPRNTMVFEPETKKGPMMVPSDLDLVHYHNKLSVHPHWATGF